MNTKETFANKFQLTLSTVDYLTRNTSLTCKCGEFKLLLTSSQSKVGLRLGNTCGKMQCHHGYGKKRPDHAAYMKKLAASGTNEKFNSTLMKPGELHNKEVNTIEFKRKVLLGKGIITTDISSEFSKQLAERNTNIDNRRKQLVMRYNTWEPQYKELVRLVCNRVPTIEWCYDLSDEQFLHYWKRVHGINSIRNNDNPNSGSSTKFKYGFVENLKFNNIGITRVRVKSSWEANMIGIFEKNKIRWSYEEYRLNSLDNTSFYVPDFVASINDKTYMIEVKGSYSFNNVDKEWYMKNKIGAGVEFCKKKGWVFCMVYKNPKDLNFLDSAVIIGE